MWDFNLPEDDLLSIVLFSVLRAHSNKFQWNNNCQKNTRIHFIKDVKKCWAATSGLVSVCELLAGVGFPTTLSVALSSQTSMVPWVRVMASLHWAAQRYCRITEQLIETNDSNNGTLSPQAGFVVGLISVAVAVRRTSHHADPSEERRRSSLLKRAVGDFYTSSV